MSLKVCTDCKVEKLVSEFERNGNYTRAKCKKCKNAQTYARRKSDPEIYNRYLERQKFWLRDYRATEHGKAARAESKRKWLDSDPSNREKAREWSRKHSRTEHGKEATRAKNRRLYRENPEKFRLRQIRHRFDLSDIELLEEVRERDKVCQLCGTDKDLSFDHIVPVALNGPLISCARQLQILCRSCNSFKGINLFLPENQGMMVVNRANNGVTV